jgi:deoxyribonuclease-4
LKHADPQTPLLGAHLSTAGGFEQAIYAAHALGCTAVQFFSKSNRQWHAPPITDEQLARYNEALHKTHLGYVAIHASYLINIASPDQAQREQARRALIIEYQRAVALNADALIVHPGSYVSGTIDASLAHIIDELRHVFQEIPTGKPKLLLETMAGQGTSTCFAFEQLATILNALPPTTPLGICFDTCHVYAAGYDLKNDYLGVMQQFDAIIGLNRLYAIHLNDSKKKVGARVDRHEHIGQGELGLATFATLMNDTRLAQVPKILETPKDHPDDDARNLQTIRDLLKA